MSKPWGPIAVGSFAAAYYIFWSSSWQDGIDSSRGTPRVRPSAPQITVPTPSPPPVPAGKTAEQKAAEEAARQEAARQEAARQEAARKAAELLAAQQRAAEQKAAEQKAAEQKAAVAAAAASAAAQAAYAAEEMARINELKKAQAAMRRAAAAKGRAEIIEEARIQNAKSRAEYEAAVAAAAPNVQTNYLITLQNPIEVSILIGNLNKAAKLHIRESSKRYVLSTRPWGNNIIPKSSKNDGYIDGLDLLKLPINPKKVDKVNRKVLESGMDEYGGGFKLTFTDNKGKKLIEIDLGSPTSVTDFPVDRVNSEINDIGRNIRYSAKVVSYN